MSPCPSFHSRLFQTANHKPTIGYIEKPQIYINSSVSHADNFQAEEDDFHTKALSDPTIKPSERQQSHDALLAERRKILEGIGSRIAEVESKHEETRAKLETAGGPLSKELVEDGGGGEDEGWTSYLDEQSGRYYWYNDTTGEASYD